MLTVMRITSNIKYIHHCLFSQPTAPSMTARSASTAARKATNITLNAALLQRARHLKINISQASEEGIARAVAARAAADWLQDNQAALDSSNAYVEQNGLPLAKYRAF